MKQTAKRIRLIACVLAALTVCGLCCSCAGRTLVTGEVGCVDQDTGTRYLHASTCYEPIALGKKYGKLEVGEHTAYDLHEIEGLDAANWLSTSDMDVLYAEGVHLPTLTEMKPVRLHVCLPDGSSGIIKLDSMENAATVQSVAAQFDNGTALSRTTQTPTDQYVIRFESEEFPGIYYKLEYMEYVLPTGENGEAEERYFLFERFGRRFVEVDDTIHNFINNVPVETDTVADTTVAP